ncbi:unnamed protein product, partial [Rotaria sordida]
RKQRAGTWDFGAIIRLSLTTFDRTYVKEDDRSET